MSFRRVTVIVLDSVGIGEMPDAKQYGDEGSHTLGSIARVVPSFDLPHLRKLGLDRIAPIGSWQQAEGDAQAYYGKMAEASTGKDTLTGHYEIMGLHITEPFQTFPNGFPPDLLSELSRRTGREIIGNKPASGTAIIEELGEEQIASGALIVYTSADSVLQIAAHEEVIPLEELYEACRIARELTSREPYKVGRVIARPYSGEKGAFFRTSGRHDYALKPPQATTLNLLNQHKIQTTSVGKIHDIFDGEGIDASYPTKNNAEGIAQTIALLKQDQPGFLFVNLVDFDSLYGHRRDPVGYAQALMQFDKALPQLLELTTEQDLLIITADHGNDPTHTGTDHTREYVPLLVYSPAFTAQGDLGVRRTFADIGATISANFGAEAPPHGTSFLGNLL